MAKEDEIRLIAYNIWEQQGCVHGHDCEHWIAAETIWRANQGNCETAKNATAKSKPAAKQARKTASKSKKS